MTSHRLRLNDLLLSAGDEPTGDDAGTWWLDVYGRDFDRGRSEPVEVTMRTLLQDGARVITTGYGVREVSFYVVIGGVNSSALAEAERVLALNLGRRGELGWLPPDGWAPETVFDIETSSMVAGSPDDEDDLRELEHNERVYLLRFVCQPHVRASEKVVVPALPVVSSATPLDEVTLDAGTAPTYWSARIGSLTDEGNFLQVGSSLSPRAVWTSDAPVSIAGRPYITLVTRVQGVPYCRVNGQPATLAGSATVLVNFAGTVRPAARYFWRTGETSVTSIEFGPTLTSYDETFDFADLRARNLPAYTGTTRQTVRTIEVGGSVRTQGELQIAAPSGGSLGSVILYTTTADVSGVPSLRQYRTSGANAETSTASNVSGAAESLAGAGTVFDVPTSALKPGKFQILARLRGTAGSYPVTWTAQTRIGSTNVGPQATGTTTVTVADAYQVMSVGTAVLPPADLPAATNGTVRLTIAGSVTYDEMWLLNLDDGAVTVVEAGSRRRLWLETATTERPRPAIYVGDAADQSDAFHDPGLLRAWGVHEFAPSVTTALVVTSGTDQASVAFEFYPRYMNFVADEAS